jgi:hypothetical protein
VDYMHTPRTKLFVRLADVENEAAPEIVQELKDLYGALDLYSFHFALEGPTAEVMKIADDPRWVVYKTQHLGTPADQLDNHDEDDDWLFI